MGAIYGPRYSLTLSSRVAYNTAAIRNESVSIFVALSVHIRDGFTIYLIGSEQELIHGINTSI